MDTTFSGFTPIAATAEPGFFFDFLGTRTRIDYLPENCHWLSGKVFGLPAPGATILHEYEEWQGVMDAVRDAKGSFVCVELGAGWGPWLVSAAFAAKQLGISEIHLIGVEADRQNMEFIKTHFADNQIDPAKHKFFHAFVGDRDSRASLLKRGGARTMSLRTLLKDLPIVDLIHCDIQFAESKAFAAGIKDVSNRVRRVVVGTHSRRIEDELIETFRSWSWALEYETACKYRIDNGVPYLNTDGVQVWRNTRALKG